MTTYDDIHLLNRDLLLKDHAVFLGDKAFLEFGVYKGVSMKMWYSLYEKHKLAIDFIGFDSFKGLPSEEIDKNSFWKSGDFNANGLINPELHKDGIRMVVGYYDQSLNEDAVKLLGNKKVGLVHMDCDTYSSTKTVWEWLLKYNILAKGALIVYDDWGAYREAKCDEYDIGEAKAHKEIEEKYGIKLTLVHQYIVDVLFYEVKVYQYD